MDIVAKTHPAFAVLSAAESAGKAADKVASAMRSYLPEGEAEQKKGYSGLLTLVRTVNGEVLPKANLGADRLRVYNALVQAWKRLNAKAKADTTTSRSWIEVRREEVDASIKALKEKEPTLLKVADVQRLLAAYEVVRSLLK